ncbi:helicase-related protein [Acidiferrobacter sp.]|jgi:SNF2 family DNA or RNA helicase|uniref:helicase-related protein n=2 Tax=Acidiferrobacter sp. TaxID=1872107 RepID=UPI0026090895|nr:helicase-related protein [Acidiferrobacter sp.]
MSPEQIRHLRKELDLTQQQFAERLGVSFVTLNRWENGQSKPSAMGLTKLRELRAEHERKAHATQGAAVPSDLAEARTGSPKLDFLGDANALRVLVEGERLSYGHLFNPAFATEISEIDPLPHQRIAVYQRMLPQSRLRFLLADDAGAGKTIMTGLYVRECLSRRTIRRVLVVAPAGLVGNWYRELRNLFQLQFKIVVGSDTRDGNPFVGPDSDLVVVSIDSLRAARLFQCLRDAAVQPYDLVVFDEAHKLSANRDLDGSFRPTDRYRLAEAIAGVRELPDDWRLPWAAHHLLLLTATPHMGKEYPYYCLWRLLEPELFSTETAFAKFPRESRERYFIRRVKEEMVDLRGKPLYPERLCDTVSYDLSQGEISEQALYDRTTAYIRHYYNQARLLNRQAARFAMTVFQRRMASSTWALLCSFRNRFDKLNGLIDDIQSGRIPEEELRAQQEKLNRKVREGRLVDVLASKTADEESTAVGKEEEHEESEAEALGALIATSLAELLVERGQVQELIALAEAVHNSGRESKFERMAALLRAPQYRDQKVIIYTEHRDTLDFLARRLEGMGYAGQVAYIHGGLGFEERDAQVERFRAPHDAEGKGARFFIGTDAAAEGINLQFCGILFNYDVPWNPARLEQRMGRIHRYGQKRDRVAIVNLVAGKTREGKVIKTLLDKLEEIRKQLGSDKVFDVVGRIFEGMSITEYIQRAVESDNEADKEALDLAGELTVEQVRAIAAREESIYGTGGEVVADLPKLRDAMAIEELRRLLPGYVRRYLEHAAPVIGIDLVGDLDGQFFLRPRKRGVLEPLLPLLDTYPESARNRFTVYRPDDKRDAIFLHPGEPVFEYLSALAIEHARHTALRGAIFTDVSATAPYLLHVARVTVVRGVDPGVPAFHSQELIEQKLVGLKQFADGRLVEAPVEHLLLLKETTKTNSDSVVFLAQSDIWRLAAQEHLHQEVATKLGELQRMNAANRLQETEDYLKRAFDYQESELAAARKRYTDKAREGNRAAGVELERIKQQQRTVAERRTQALLQARREVELIQPGTVEILATALVQPSQDPEDIKARDAEVERIAMDVAIAFEAARGADVRDVSTPPRAKLAGLNDYPGFDLLSRRGNGDALEERGIEVKGRVGVGEIELTENEWARACNLRDKYWLYAVFDCGGNQPRLFRVQDPFANLIAKARGSVVIGYSDIVRGASE